MDEPVCADKLPQAADGMWTDQPAASAPSLPAIDEAWVCQYAANDANEWVLDGEAQPVDAGLLPDIESGLGGLAPAEADLMCTADIGPRWLLTYATGSDLTSVVVDDFGCRSVRLTDEPFGALSAPDGLLDAIKAAGA